MRSERLLRLLMILQAVGRISVKELSRRLEVSARTVQRDLEALCLAGIPLYAERGQGGGWRLSEGYRTSLTGMNRRELLSLLLGGEAIAGDLNLIGSLQSAREKIFASVPAPDRQALHQFQERMHVDGAGWFSSGEELALLAPLQEAVFSGKQILARYGLSEERILNPLGLVIKGRIWYIVAMHEMQVRSYRASRFTDVRLLSDDVQRPPGFDLARYWQASLTDFKKRLPEFQASIRLPRLLLKELQRPFVHLLTDDDGSGNSYLQVDVRFDTMQVAVEIVLQYAPVIEVVSPESLKFEVKRRMEAWLSQYS